MNHSSLNAVSNGKTPTLPEEMPPTALILSSGRLTGLQGVFDIRRDVAALDVQSHGQLPVEHVLRPLHLPLVHQSQLLAAADHQFPLGPGAANQLHETGAAVVLEL